MDKKIKILFLCTHNSCRSQIAEGLLRDMAGDKFDIYSAGVEPTSVHPLAKKVMKEIGIDISGQHSKSVIAFMEKGFDYVITVLTTLDKPVLSSRVITNYCTGTWRIRQEPKDRMKKDLLFLGKSVTG